MKTKLFFYWICGICLLGWAGCRRQEPKLIVIDNNNAPNYQAIPTILVENYVNRLYIDLVGREPTDAELSQETNTLKNGGLSQNARASLIQKLQTNTDYVAGDSSYKIAYYHRLYELAKIRAIEGASNEDIQQSMDIFSQAILSDSLSGNFVGVELARGEYLKLKSILDSEEKLREGQIDIRDLYYHVVYNWIYDQINMNSFNFIRASFNDLFGRYPTDAEFEAVYNAIEYSTSGVVLGKSCSDKASYTRILVESKEFHEGMIRWAYITLMAREAKTAEVFDAMQSFYTSHNFAKVQEKILVTDEYAGFLQ